MWVRFTADVDWKPRPQITIAYSAGMTLNIPTPAAQAALAAGRAVRMRKTTRDSEPIHDEA